MKGEIVIRTNRANKGGETDMDEKAFEDRLSLTHDVVKDVVKTIFGGIFAYVVLDTFRQVLIARNTNIQVFE